jgi:hypothetical protein
MLCKMKLHLRDGQERITLWTLAVSDTFKHCVVIGNFLH